MHVKKVSENAACNHLYRINNWHSEFLPISSLMSRNVRSRTPVTWADVISNDFFKNLRTPWQCDWPLITPQIIDWTTLNFPTCSSSSIVYGQQLQASSGSYEVTKQLIYAQSRRTDFSQASFVKSWWKNDVDGFLVNKAVLYIFIFFFLSFMVLKCRLQVAVRCTPIGIWCLTAVNYDKGWQRESFWGGN